MYKEISIRSNLKITKQTFMSALEDFLFSHRIMVFGNLVNSV